MIAADDEDVIRRTHSEGLAATYELIGADRAARAE
jgi:hypothetical protein